MLHTEAKNRQRMRYVKKTSLSAITKAWGKEFADSLEGNDYFVRANRFGEVNWNRSSLYTPSEIKKDKKIVVLQ
jgi:hypothetical protein